MVAQNKEPNQFKKKGKLSDSRTSNWWQGTTLTIKLT